MPVAAAYRRPLTDPSFPLTPASPPADIRRLQEWLVLHGYDVGLNKSKSRYSTEAVGIDGDFGRLTETACRNFCFDRNRTFRVIDADFWFILTAPLIAAAGYTPKARTFGGAIVELAQVYLLQDPRETRVQRDGILYGKDNSGPWVDFFNHGIMAPWCLGAVDTLIEQAAHTTGMPAPLSTMLDGVRCLWVPRMVDEARQRGIYLGGNAAVPSALKPGSIFFVRNSPGASISHTHTGIVEQVMIDGKSVMTIEGNTNTGGSPEGWRFIRRTRTIAALDYAVIE